MEDKKIPDNEKDAQVLETYKARLRCVERSSVTVSSRAAMLSAHVERARRSPCVRKRAALDAVG